MSAKLIITEGDATGKEVPIQFSVLRIGSGASCEVQVRGIADVAATLRFDQGRYQLLNRSPNPIELAGTTLEPQQSKHWANQGLLRLSDKCVLTLVIDGDPAPRNLGSINQSTLNQLAASQVTEPDSEDEEDGALSNEPTPAAKMDPQKAFQLAVIILCVVAGIGLQGFDYLRSTGMLDTSSSATTTVDKKVLSEKFQYPIDTLLKKEDSLRKSKAEEHYFQYVQLREALQEARIADVREDWNTAAFYYREVLEQMDALHLTPSNVKPAASPEDKTKKTTPSLKMPKAEFEKLPLELQLDLFVRQRLAQIDPKVSKFTDPDA